MIDPERGPFSASDPFNHPFYLERERDREKDATVLKLPRKLEPCRQRNNLAKRAKTVDCFHQTALARRFRAFTARSECCLYSFDNDVVRVLKRFVDITQTECKNREISLQRIKCLICSTYMRFISSSGINKICQATMPKSIIYKYSTVYKYCRLMSFLVVKLEVPIRLWYLQPRSASERITCAHKLVKYIEFAQSVAGSKC